MSDTITSLIAGGENQTTEFKASLKLREEMGRTLSAFANADGGILLVGVSDQGEALGVEIGARTVEDLANWVKGNTDPAIYPAIKVQQVEGKSVIAISIRESEEKPVFFKDRAFQRVGKTSQRISSGKIRELAQEQRVRLHWDELVCDGGTLADIDEEKVKWFLSKARQERSLGIDPDIPVEEALERLRLARDGRLTNAAILLFAHNPQRFFVTAETRCGRFKGSKPVKPFLDMKVFAGSIIDQVQAAVDFVLRHISLEAWVEAGRVDRQEQWEYPPDAIREAIVNAVCHRDYEVSSNVQVRIFRDRLEVWGCGSLPVPLTVDALKRQHSSVLRNPLIGRVFFLLKFIEQWGTGTNDIVSMCLERGLPEPVFEDVSGSLVVTFRKYHLPEDIDELDVNDRQAQALEFTRERGQIRLGEFRKLCPDIPERTLRKDLADLVEVGLLQAVGEKRGRRYILR